MQLDTLLSQRETQFLGEGILLSVICYHLVFRLPLRSTWAMLWRPASERDEEKQNWEAHIVHYARKHYQNRRRETYELALRMAVHLNGFGIVWAGPQGEFSWVVGWGSLGFVPVGPRFPHVSALLSLVPFRAFPGKLHASLHTTSARNFCAQL